MSALEVRGVSVAFGAAPVFEDASFVLGPGWTGLVGANGAGKSTLLRVIAGVQAPSEGVILSRPKDASIVLCPQEVLEPNDDVHALASSDDAHAMELKGRLGLADVERWPTLSPGERKRWQIGAALARSPDVLLLDEPTNHIDRETRTRLLAALRRFRGIGVVVSHDRELLEALPTATVRVHAGAVTKYEGAYAAARRTWEEARAAREAAHVEAKHQVRLLERRLDDARRVQASAAKSTSARSRMKNSRDHDAKDSMRKGRAASADARAGRNVANVRAAMERIDVPSIERDRTIGGKVFASYVRAPNPVLFHLDSPTLRAGDRVVLRDVRLSIGRADRVRIAGPNGIGKTTLLSALVSTAPRRVLHLPQELDDATTATHLDALRAASDEDRGRALSIFAALGSDPERIRGRTAGLSPGEARKLALACGLGMHAWALVLDEPTNHLDLPTIEKLEHTLRSFPGCLVLVTHDDAFAEAVGAQTIDVAIFRHGDDVGV